jgi:hypothetical protein
MSLLPQWSAGVDLVTDVSLLGIPGASVQETPIRGSMVTTVEENAGLLLCRQQTKTPDHSDVQQ